MFFIPELFLLGALRLTQCLVVSIKSVLTLFGPVSITANVQKSVAQTTPLCQLRLRSYHKPTGIIFRWSHYAIPWVQLKSVVISSFLSLLLLLISVAFFTLIERKVLGYIMLRRGPNSPSLAGLLIPFADAIKLLGKPFIIPFLGSYFLIFFSCFVLFLVPAALWLLAQPPSFNCVWSLPLLSLLV